MGFCALAAKSIYPTPTAKISVSNAVYALKASVIFVAIVYIIRPRSIAVTFLLATNTH
jgi:hypothetical protein